MTRRALRVGAGVAAVALVSVLLLAQLLTGFDEAVTTSVSAAVALAAVTVAAQASASRRHPTAAATAAAVVGVTLSSAFWPQLAWWGVASLTGDALAAGRAQGAAALGLMGQLAGVALGTLAVTSLGAAVGAAVGAWTTRHPHAPRPPDDHPIGASATLAAALPLAVLSLAATVAFVAATLPSALALGAAPAGWLPGMAAVVALAALLPMIAVVAWSWAHAASGLRSIAASMAGARASWASWGPLAGLCLATALILVDHAARTTLSDGRTALQHEAAMVVAFAALAAGIAGWQRAPRPLPPLPGEEVIDGGLLTWLGVSLVGGLPIMTGILSQHGAARIAHLARSTDGHAIDLTPIRHGLVSAEVTLALAYTHVRLALTVVPWVAVAGLAAWLAADELAAIHISRHPSAGERGRAGR